MWWTGTGEASGRHARHALEHGREAPKHRMREWGWHRWVSRAVTMLGVAVRFLVLARHPHVVHLRDVVFIWIWRVLPWVVLMQRMRLQLRRLFGARVVVAVNLPRLVSTRGIWGCMSGLERGGDGNIQLR